MNVYLTEEPVNFRFMMFPAFLLNSGLNLTCQFLYMLLLDRTRLSQKNGWIDERGHVFIHYTIDALAKDLGKGITTIKDSLKVLDEADLIDRIPQGFQKPNRIYVKIPEEAVLELQAAGKPASNPPVFRPSSGQNLGLHGAGYPAANNNYRVRVNEPKFINYDCEGNSL